MYFFFFSWKNKLAWFQIFCGLIYTEPIQLSEKVRKKTNEDMRQILNLSEAKLQPSVPIGDILVRYDSLLLIHIYHFFIESFLIEGIPYVIDLSFKKKIMAFKSNILPCSICKH